MIDSGKPVYAYFFRCSISPASRASSISALSSSPCSNTVSCGSPSRIRSVRRISLGITTLPNSSILRTMPVARTNCSLLHCSSFSRAASASSASRGILHALVGTGSGSSPVTGLVCGGNFRLCVRRKWQCLTMRVVPATVTKAMHITAYSIHLFIILQFSIKF